MNTVPASNDRRIGSIRWREDRQAFEIRLRDPQRKRRSYYSPGPNTPAQARAAEELRAARIAGFAKGERHIGRKLTVGAWLDQWLEIQQASDAKPETLRAYRGRIELYLRPTFGRILLADLDELAIARGFAALKRKRGDEDRGDRVEYLSDGTREAAWKALRAAIRAAYRAGKIGREPMAGMRGIRSSTHIEPPTHEELDRLFEAIGEHPFRPIFSVMRWTGARHGEVLGMRRSRKLLEDGIFEIVKQQHGGTTKTRRPRAVILPPHVLEELRAIPPRVGTDLIFSTASGKPLDERNVLRVFDAALEATGIRPPAIADLDKYRPHDLRHSFATMLLEAGVSESVVAGWLGHASTRMLERYSHVRTLPGGESYRRMLEAWGDGLLLFGLRPAA